MKDSSHLSIMIADILAGKDNQHCTIMTTGRTGSGKSLANLNLFEQVSYQLEARLGGNARDYFNIDNVAVISKDEVKRVVRRFKKHGLYLMDDIGISWNSRKFRDPINILLNDLFQTFRLDNNLLGCTIPDSFLIDKVPRSLVHYFVEMDQALFHRGITTAKVFEVVRKPRSGDTHYMYINEHGKYVRYIFGLPSEELLNEYNKRRQNFYDILKEERLAQWDALDEKEQKKQAPRQLKKDLIPSIDTDIIQGMSKVDACKKGGMTTRYYDQIKRGG